MYYLIEYCIADMEMYISSILIILQSKKKSMHVYAYLISCLFIYLYSYNVLKDCSTCHVRVILLTSLFLLFPGNSLQSKNCNLHNMTPKELVAHGELVNETGGFFIVNGAARILR